MAIKVVSGAQVDSWINDGVDLAVKGHFLSHAEATIEGAAASLQIPYEQVFWALSFISSGRTFLFQALPTNDAEIQQAQAANSSFYF